MATRTQVVRECDSGGCRRRKGVQEYVYSVRDREGNQVRLSNDEIVEDVIAEHCPYHLHLAVYRLERSIINTKDYPQEEVS